MNRCCWYRRGGGLKLTDSEVGRAKAGERPWKISDGHGLHLLVQPNGSKLWRFAYRFDGRQKLLALGRYPVITLAMARELHLEARRLLAAYVGAARIRRSVQAFGVKS